jgi:hypothetical protein
VAAVASAEMEDRARPAARTGRAASAAAVAPAGDRAVRDGAVLMALTIIDELTSDASTGG